MMNRHKCLLKLLLIAFCLTCFTQASQKIIVMQLIVSDSLLNGHQAISSVYDVAFQRAQKMYPRIFENMERLSAYLPGNYTCAEAEAQTAQFFGSLYGSLDVRKENQSLIVILTPGCSLEALALGDLAREIDCLLLASTATDGRLSNKVRYPTTIAMGSSGYSSIGLALVTIFDRFTWRKAAIFCDKSTSDLDEATLLTVGCNQVRDAFSKRLDINIVSVNMDTSRSLNFTTHITMARDHTSIFVLVLRTHKIGTFLKQVADQGLNTGKHTTNLFVNRHRDLVLSKKAYKKHGYHFLQVFLFVRNHNFCKEGLRFMEGLSNDDYQKVTSVLPYVFQLTSVMPIGENIAEDWQLIRQLARRNYSTVLSEEYEFNGIQLTAYEAVLVMVQVLNENIDQLRTLGGAELGRFFTNHTFHLPVEEVKISSSGMKTVDVAITSYHNRSNDFKLLWMFSSKDFVTFFLKPTNTSIHWPGSIFPPTSDPVCYKDDCLLNQGDKYSMFALMCLLLALVIVVVALRKRLFKRDSSWWMLEKSKITLFPDFAASNWLEEMCGSAWRIHPGLFQAQPVETVILKCDVQPKAFVHGEIAKLIQKMKRAEHPNVGRFFGISIINSVSNYTMIAVVHEATIRGTLRELIDKKASFFSWDLRYSLIWDLIEGLEYLSSSGFKAHGMIISFINLLIDEHFTLKITRSGLVELSQKVSSLNNENYNPPLIFLPWLAPEVTDVHGNMRLEKFDSSSDIYSLGVTLYEITTGNTPFDMDLNHPDSIKVTMEKIRHNRSLIWDEDTEGLSKNLVLLINHCLKPVASDRPTLEHVKEAMNHERPLGKANFSANLIEALQQHQDELEKIVLSRTDDLRAEISKVDELLSTMLPMQVICKLRNKKEILAETFECITLMFSDIPAFNELVATCTPIYVIDVLTELYMVFDEKLRAFDVYKVETIRDCYMVASGLPERNGEEHVCEIARTAISFLKTISQVRHVQSKESLKVRIGINSGPVVATVIGHKLPHYCLVGDTVNTASRMESTGLESRIQVSMSTYSLLKSKEMFKLQYRGKINVKGKGEQHTYWLLDSDDC